MSTLDLAQEREVSRSAWADVAVLLVAAALIGIYAVLRYGGHWGEGDTSTFSRAIRSVADTGELAPRGQFVYNNGYNYSALVVFFMHLTGISLADVQIYAAPLLVVWLVVPAWLAYRELTGSTRGATLATAILLIQPELLFALLRGTHEKFTRGMMLLCLFLLLRSLRIRHPPARFAALVLSFYIVGYGMISSNNLMATSFTVGLGIAVGLIWTLNRWGSITEQLGTPVIRRLGFVITTLVAIAFVFSFYAYIPAQGGLRLIESMWNRTTALLLNIEAESSNPYTVVRLLWISPGVYLLVSLANWLLLLSSATIWTFQSLRWIVHRKGPTSTQELFMWAFYGAFAFQGALSVIVDISGAIGGNLQHRIFPSFAMIGAPLVAHAIVEWRPRRPLVGRVAYAALGLGLGFLALMSVFKATNEPMLGNKWLFYVPGELQAVSWAEQHLTDRAIWSEFDERIFAAKRVGNGATNFPLNISPSANNPAMHNVLVSDVTRKRAERNAASIPIEVDSLITYDNGQAQIYHLRPRTPYQP